MIIIGAGRAGGALALASAQAGHEIAGIVSRDGASDYGPPLALDEPFPNADLVVLAVRDAQIEGIAQALATAEDHGYPVAAHLSGFVPVSALAPLAEVGVSIGGMHPLQTLPDAIRGAQALSGAFAGIEGDRMAIDTLTHLAESLGMRVFRLADEHRPAYHAAAAAAANFVVTSLATAADIFESAGVDPAVVRPLVEQAIENVFTDREGSLTGPIARGDLETVVGHLTAAHLVSESVGAQFRLLAEATALRAGRGEETRRWS